MQLTLRKWVEAYWQSLTKGNSRIVETGRNSRIVALKISFRSASFFLFLQVESVHVLKANPHCWIKQVFKIGRPPNAADKYQEHQPSLLDGGRIHHRIQQYFIRISPLGQAFSRRLSVDEWSVVSNILYLPALQGIIKQVDWWFWLMIFARWCNHQSQ